MLDQQNFDADKLPDNDTLMSRHVGDGTCYEVCCVICFTVFAFVHFVGFLRIEYKNMHDMNIITSDLSLFRHFRSASGAQLRTRGNGLGSSLLVGNDTEA